MPLSESTTQITLKTHWVYCDICHFSPRSELRTRFEIEAAGPESMGYTLGPAYRPVDLPTLEVKLKQLASEGWETRKIIGKDFLICPSCVRQEKEQEKR